MTFKLYLRACVKKLKHIRMKKQKNCWITNYRASAIHPFVLQRLYCSYSPPVQPNYEIVQQSWGSVALQDINGQQTYSQIFTKSLRLKSMLESILKIEEQKHVAILLNNDVSYVIAKWAIWAATHVAVPLHPSYPVRQLEYFLKDSKTDLVITNKSNSEKLGSVLSGQQVIILDEEFMYSSLNSSEEKMSEEFCKRHKELCLPNYGPSNALIIYTSGTTGPPKGVVLTHRNLLAQIKSLVDAWKITSKDVLLHCLPLNHVHGIVNALFCPLYCGARVIMEPKFEASNIWSQLLNLNVTVDSRINLFMAVPTIYAKLIEEYEKKFAKNERMKKYIKNYCQENIRLMISGSASLPTPILEKWHDITGHILLERYGMTEIGMALSNPLKGERTPGFVGTPLATTIVRICEFSPKRDSMKILCEGSSRSTSVSDSYKGEPGELLIKGENVFSQYWQKEEDTKKAFTEDGWFITGDTAAYENGKFKILGRTSVDIIKSGGFKISALDIERSLLTHPYIKDVAVVGLPDITWGEKIAAAIVWQGSDPFDLQKLRLWAKEVMPHYHIPSVVKTIPDQLPRNNMGKVNKKLLVKDYFTEKS